MSFTTFYNKDFSAENKSISPCLNYFDLNIQLKQNKQLIENLILIKSFAFVDYNKAYINIVLTKFFQPNIINFSWPIH